MKRTSLREIIDDLLLDIRNSNISESEDISRSHLAAMIDHYRRMLWKKHLDELKEQEKAGVDIEDLVDGEFILLKETGPHKLVKVESGDPHRDTFTKKTEDTLENIFDNKWRSFSWGHC